MNQEFKQCIENKKIIPFATGKKLVNKELSVAQSDLLNAMNLRESADYDAEFSQSGAKSVIESADKFIQKAIEILNTNTSS